MKIINKVKYENVFYEVDFYSTLTKCFICEDTFGKEMKFYTTTSISVLNKEIANVYRICNDCVKSEEEAEKVIIPLLKIVHGGRVKVKRWDNNIKFKTFYY